MNIEKEIEKAIKQHSDNEKMASVLRKIYKYARNGELDEDMLNSYISGLTKERNKEK